MSLYGYLSNVSMQALPHQRLMELHINYSITEACSLRLHTRLNCTLFFLLSAHRIESES